MLYSSSPIRLLNKTTCLFYKHRILIKKSSILFWTRYRTRYVLPLGGVGRSHSSEVFIRNSSDFKICKSSHHQHIFSLLSRTQYSNKGILFCMSTIATLVWLNLRQREYLPRNLTNKLFWYLTFSIKIYTFIDSTWF